MSKLVIDTNVVVAALRKGSASAGAARRLLRAALTGRCRPLFGNALWLEYEDVLERPVWTNDTTRQERGDIMRALAAAGQWIHIYYGWRPNLPDEGDNHLFELAVAGNADAIVTYNLKDLRRGELCWPGLKILTPSEYLEQFL